jgi:chaperone BCS1
MSLPLPSRDAARLLKPGYSQLLDLVHDVVGVDPMILVNIGLVIVGLSTFVRYVLGYGYRYAQDVFGSTVRIEDEDPLYDHLMRWMADHQFLNRQFRSVKAISTPKSSWEDEEEALKSMIGGGLHLTEPDPNNLISYRSIVGRSPISLQPFQGTHLFRRHGSWILFKHRVNSGSQLVPLPKERGYITLQCVGFSTAPLQRLMEEAQLYNLERTRTTTTIFRAISNVRDVMRWTKFSARPSRDISTVIFDQKKKQALLKDINEYLHPHTRRWYSNHGIPYRRGYLFSGAPGTGKTSLTSALAGIFGLDIFVLSLLDPNLNESQLMRLMSEIPPRCIVLLEDVDAAGLTRPETGNNNNNDREKSQLRRRGAANNTPQQWDGTDLLSVIQPSAGNGSNNNSSGTAPGVSVSLSGLLNAIDGVSSQEGRILIMTTNSPEMLDKALVRPGRVDMHIVFELPSREEMRELFLSMYNDYPRTTATVTATTTSTQSPSSARDKADRSRDEKDSPPSLENGDISLLEKEEKNQSDLDLDLDLDLESLAQKFASSIPEKRLSLAALQGFLLLYKKEPREACENAAAWAGKTLQRMEQEEGQRQQEI